MGCIVLIALIVIVLIKILLLICGLGTKMSKKLKIYTFITCIMCSIAIPIVCLSFDIVLNGFFELIGIIIGVLIEGLDVFLYDRYSLSKGDKKK